MDIKPLFEQLISNRPQKLREDDPLTVENWTKVCRSFEIIEQILTSIQAPPIGFMYVQFPGQNSAEELWPLCTWKVIPPERYNGCFFRAEGGEADDFNNGVQDYAMVELKGNFPGGCGGFTDGVFRSQPQHNPVWNIGNASVGAGMINAAEQKNFDISNTLGSHHIASEIRPVNQTIRIWERLA